MRCWQCVDDCDMIPRVAQAERQARIEAELVAITVGFRWDGSVQRSWSRTVRREGVSEQMLALAVFHCMTFSIFSVCPESRCDTCFIVFFFAQCRRAPHGSGT